jgi:dolichyl-phosphate beta-glucosyltransferase
MFTRNAAQLIFPSQHVDRWAFDVEVLYLCHAFEIPVGEVPVSVISRMNIRKIFLTLFVFAQVTWQEVGGSKVTLSGMFGMLRDIVLIRVLFVIGVWKTMVKAKHL